MYQPLSIDLKTMEKQQQDVDVVCFLLSLKPEYESIRAQILGGLELQSISEFFSSDSACSSFDQSSQLSSKHNGNRAAFIAVDGGFGSPHGVRGGWGGLGFRGGCDSRGGDQTGSREPCKCTQCVHL